MSNGVILYQGPSNINGKEIVAIAVGLSSNSKNRKTGGMVQVHILGTDVEPHLAIKNGTDDTICGECVHRGDPTTGRGRSCYVQVGQGPLMVYRAWKRGSYTPIKDYSIFSGRQVRFGAYGDPAAVPASVWEAIVSQTKSITGYTHQWKKCDPVYSNWLMASADSVEEAAQAQALGYRTFRVSLLSDGKLAGEAMCPASKEAGYKLKCFECLACNGNITGRKGNIVINVHGSAAHLFNAKKIPIKMAA